MLGDSGYGAGATRAALRTAGHVQTIKPIPLASATPGGFTIHDFRIDRQAGTVRCPAGHQAPIAKSGQVSFARCAPGLPAPPALHHRQAWAHDPDPPPRRRAACCPPPGGDPQLPAELPALAADGGTLDRLAGR